MKDQAERLREIMKNSNNNSLNELENKKIEKTRILAITSGKGGVGKTNFTINLGISLSNLGYKVLIFDADIGLANVDIILGVIPRYTIADVINGNKGILDIITEGPNGIKVIAGGSGIKELASLDNNRLEKITLQLAKLENIADFILIDTGAGLSETVLSFVNAADEVILITTPEPTSLTDGYAMIKTLAINSRFSKIHVVINRAEDYNEATEVFEKLRKVASRFLKIRIENLGFVYDSKIVSDSVKSQNPFLVLFPNSAVSKKINGIALKILGNSSDSSDGVKGFVNKLKNFFVKEGT